VTIVNVRDEEAVRPSASVTWMVAAEAPAVVGVPVAAPPDASESPAGSDPVLSRRACSKARQGFPDVFESFNAKECLRRRNTHGQFTASVLRPPNKSRCESVLSLGATSSKGGSMMRKTTIALFALAAVGLTQPTAAFAHGGGGGGGGDHGGGGGGPEGAVASIAALVSKALV
jgi:hypothetical protein